MNRINIKSGCFLLTALIGLWFATPSLQAQAPATPPPPAANLEQRVADLEAYITNTPQGGKDGKEWTTKIASPGTGHNGWMMTSAALVLFMTLPGLALFYGGLVRTKNVLSVMAQCLGIAGLVTILWWAFGYSLVFGKN